MRITVLKELATTEVILNISAPSPSISPTQLSERTRIGLQTMLSVRDGTRELRRLTTSQFLIYHLTPTSVLIPLFLL